MRPWRTPYLTRVREWGYARVVRWVDGGGAAAVGAVADKGMVCVLDIDVQGADQCKQAKLPAIFMFIAPPSFEELERRLRALDVPQNAQ